MKSCSREHAPLRRGDPQRVCVRPPLRAYRSEAVDADAVVRVLNSAPIFVRDGCGMQRGRGACQTVAEEPTLLRKQVRYYAF